MSDADTEYDTNDDGGVGETKSLILYPVLASVFSAFCIISIAIFLLSNRKCCKRKIPDDAESALLKQRLVHEQKRMAAYRFKCPFDQRPLFCSIMQQEDNDIAEEVKESYKMISTTVNKPIICCPDKKNSYVYNPIQSSLTEKVENSKTPKLKEGLQSEQLFVFEEVPADNGCHNDMETYYTDVEADSLNGDANRGCGGLNDCEISERHDVLFDSLKKTIHASSDRQSVKGKVSDKLFTESEIENVSDLKSLLFKKWIHKNNDWVEGKPVSLSHLSSYQCSTIVGDDDNDDLESILTSISRMDSCRIKRLRDSKFYKHLISQMNTIDAGETPCMGNVDDEMHAINSLLVSKASCKSESNMTHEELLQAVIQPADRSATRQTKQELSALQHDGDDGWTTSVCEDGTHTNSYKYPSGMLHGTSKSHLSSVMSPEYSSYESKSSVTIKTAVTSSTSSSLNSSSVKSRPNSLALKRKNTDLNIDVTFTNERSISTFFSESAMWISGGKTSDRSSVTSCSSTAISQETDQTSDQTRTSNSVTRSLSSSYSNDTPTQKSETSDASRNLMKKYRKPGKYKAPRNTQKRRKKEETSSPSDTTSSSRFKPKKSSSNITSKYHRELKENKRLPKFVTGSKQIYKSRKNR